MHKRFWAFFERVAPRTLREINLRANISEWTYREQCCMYIKWVYNINHAKNKLHKHYRVFRRDREPSRIPIRTLERLRGKNRKVREFVYKGIRSYTPAKSSKVLCYVIVIKQRNKAKFLFKGSGTIQKSLLKFRKRASRYLSLCSPSVFTRVRLMQRIIVNLSVEFFLIWGHELRDKVSSSHGGL